MNFYVYMTSEQKRQILVVDAQQYEVEDFKTFFKLYRRRYKPAVAAWAYKNLLMPPKVKVEKCDLNPINNDLRNFTPNFDYILNTDDTEPPLPNNEGWVSFFTDRLIKQPAPRLVFELRRHARDQIAGADLYRTGPLTGNEIQHLIRLGNAGNKLSQMLCVALFHAYDINNGLKGLITKKTWMSVVDKALCTEIAENDWANQCTWFALHFFELNRDECVHLYDALTKRIDENLEDIREVQAIDLYMRARQLAPGKKKPPMNVYFSEMFKLLDTPIAIMEIVDYSLKPKGYPYQLQEFSAKRAYDLIFSYGVYSTYLPALMVRFSELLEEYAVLSSHRIEALCWNFHSSQPLRRTLYNACFKIAKPKNSPERVPEARSTKLNKIWTPETFVLLRDSAVHARLKARWIMGLTKLDELISALNGLNKMATDLPYMITNIALNEELEHQVEAQVSPPFVHCFEYNGTRYLTLGEKAVTEARRMADFLTDKLKPHDVLNLSVSSTIRTLINATSSENFKRGFKDLEFQIDETKDAIRVNFIGQVYRRNQNAAHYPQTKFILDAQDMVAQ